MSELNMSKKFNKLLAPIVIAGITIGFLASAYKFVFAKKKTQNQDSTEKNETESQQ